MAIAKTAEQATGRVLAQIAQVMAYGGGIILAGLAVMTLISVIGRRLTDYGLKPITGDYELVEAGCAIAVFAFLPWCQLNRGHVTVDIFVARLPAAAQRVLVLFGDLLIAAVAFVIMWRLYLGFGEKFPYGSDAFRSAFSMGYKPFFAETSYELEIPVWIPFGLALLGAVMFFVISIYTVWRSLNETLDGAEGVK
jgi:TRAP-type C4-dicarboxylate transport system permease small subunit